MNAKVGVKSWRPTYPAMVFVALCVFALESLSLWYARAARTVVQVESSVTLRAEKRRDTTMNLRDGVTVPTEYAAEIDSSRADALALTSADVDGDGVPDLISGYRTPNGGWLSVHRGNVESIFPGTAEAAPAPFFPRAKTFILSEAPEFLVAGDFDNDGKQDVVAAAKGARGLHFLRGDGIGNLLPPDIIELEGDVTALAAGDLNGGDGLTEIAVGLSGAEGPSLLIFEGWNGALAAGAEPETIRLPNPAAAFAFAPAGLDGFGDLAIAAGTELLILRGRDRELTLSKASRRETAPAIARRELRAKVTAVAIGRFSGGPVSDIALLTGDGDLHLIARTEPRSQSATVSRFAPLASSDSSLVSARVSANGSSDDLLVLDRANSGMHVLKASDHTFGVEASLSGAAIAALPMRLNKDGLDDIVYLSANHVAPSVAMTAPTAIFTVNSTANRGDGNHGNGVCADSTGACTLRAAIQEANSFPGADEIRFNLPGAGPFVFAPNDVSLDGITETLTIDGSTQPGFTGSPIIQIDGSAVIVTGGVANGLDMGTRTIPTATNASGSVVRSLVLLRNTNSGIRIQRAGVENVRVEGCFIGTDVTGMLARANGTGTGTQRGGVVLAGTNHRIGGTTAAARNVISGNESHGIHLPSGSVITNTSTIISGNLIGTSADGTGDLGNDGDGIRAGGVTGVTIGPNNVVSGNTGSGLFLSAINAIVEGNRVGTSPDGNTDLGNDQSGIRLAGAGRIGGTAAAAGNVISGNGQDGIRLSASVGVAIQGNAIGTRADGGAFLLNDRHGIFLTDAASDTLIGGDVATPGPCTAPCNIVAFGANGRAISIVNASAPTTEQPGRIDASGSPEDSGGGNKIFKIEPRDREFRLPDDYQFVDNGNDGPDSNDDGDNDMGPNGRQNHPNFDCRSGSTTAEGVSSISCEGTLNSAPNQSYRLDFYQTTLSGNEAIWFFLGRTQVTTGASGNAVFNQAFGIQAPQNKRISAIATNNTTGDTSENSPTGGIGSGATPTPTPTPTPTATPTPTPPSCSFLVDPLQFINVPATGDTVRVVVTTQQGCNWSASSNDPGMIVGGGTFTGPDSVTFTVRANSFNPRAGSVLVAGQTVSVSQLGGCTFFVVPPVFNISFAGGPITAQVETASACSWSGASNTPFITGGGNRTGPGLVSFNVEVNGTSAVRNGSVTVAGRMIPVNQGVNQSCSFAVQPLSVTVPRDGGQFTINVSSQPGCFWASSNSSFILGGNDGGVGSGSVTFEVLQNNTLQRQANVIVAGQTVRVVQLSVCSYRVTPPVVSFAEREATTTVQLETDSFCQWETSGSDTAFVIPASGTGSTTLTVGTTGNTGPDPRSRTITIADQTVTVNQSGCQYTLDPGVLLFPSHGFSRSFELDAGSPTCEWEARLSSNLTGFVTPAAGTGDQTIFVALASNPGMIRSGSVAVTGGGSLQITQLPKGSQFDFNFDNKADFATVGADDGDSAKPDFSNASSPEAAVNWRINNSSDGTERSVQFGDDSDKIVPGDYNGDGLSDLAVWRPSTGFWFIARPTGNPAQNFDAIQFGATTDRPVPADYDGDGKTDIAVYRPSSGIWFIRESTSGQSRAVQWGVSTDKAVPADYDGDGKADLAIWRPSDGIWHILRSANNQPLGVQWGITSDRPVPGDYDGDFKTDIAVFRPAEGIWYILRSTSGDLQAVQWGLAGDVLVPADYDADLKTDTAVWRPSSGTWFVLRSSDGAIQSRQLGRSGDVPVPSALLPQ